jgi:2-polyprenyl-3-methyl-5-hydroxy-6-metoxy-1,4-benzoquinol methylase
LKGADSVDDRSATYRGWEYAAKGDYHANLDPNWPFAPTYLRRNEIVREFLGGLPPGVTVLDAGCGEGVLVKEFREHGMDISGLDLNYESERVKRGDLCRMPFADGSFDAVLLLDVLEHLEFKNQDVALAEIRRVMKQGACLVLSVPNQAHLLSRWGMVLRGELVRADVEENHPGERPLRENIRLVRQAGFRAERIEGVTLPLPYIYRRLICRHPAKYTRLHNRLDRLAPASLCLITVLFCRRCDTVPPR